MNVYAFMAEVFATARNCGRRAILVLIMCTGVSACGAARTNIRYGELTTHTEMSESVFIDLRSDLAPTVFISEACTAGREITLQSVLEDELSARGYRVVEAPEHATYLIQLNHLRLAEFELGEGQTARDAVELAWMAGLGTTVAAAVVGAESVADELGLAAGAAAFLLDATTKHIAHTLTTDLLLTETVWEEEGRVERLHATQIVSGASKVNLTLEEALPGIISGMTSSLSGLLPDKPGLHR